LLCFANFQGGKASQTNAITSLGMIPCSKKSPQKGPQFDRQLHQTGCLARMVEVTEAKRRDFLGQVT